MRSAWRCCAIACDSCVSPVRAAINAVVAQAYGFNREQYAHVLSTFSHKSYPKAPFAEFLREKQRKVMQSSS